MNRLLLRSFHITPSGWSQFFSTWHLLLRHPLAKQATVLVSSQYVAMAISFVTTVLAARLLGPKEYGITAVIIAYPALLWSFVSTKSVDIVTRYIATFSATNREHLVGSLCKLAYLIDMAIALFVLSLVSISSWWLAPHLLDFPGMPQLMILYATSFPFYSLIGTSTAVLTVWRQFHWLGVLQIVEKAMLLLVVPGLLVAGFGVKGMIWGTVVGHVVFGLTMFVAAVRVMAANGIGQWWNSDVRDLESLKKELAAFFGWNYLAVTMTGSLTNVPAILLGRLRGAEEAGFFRLAMNIITIGGYFEGSLGRIVYPMLSRWRAEGRRDQCDNNCRRWTIFLGIPSGLLLFGVMCLVPELIKRMFGARYSPMSFGTQIMFVGVVVGAVFFWLSSWYYAEGRIGLWTKLYGAYAITVCAVAAVAGAQIGFLGVAWCVGLGRALLYAALLFWR